MKLLVMIVNTSLQQKLADVLRGLPQIQGFTFSHAEGHGLQEEHDPFLSARDKVVGYVPRIRVDILLEDDQVDGVLEIVSTTAKGGSESGVFWVNDVQKSGRLCRPNRNSI